MLIYRYGGIAANPCASMLQDAPVAAYVLRDWLLCRQKPLRALPAYLWRPPHSSSRDPEGGASASSTTTTASNTAASAVFSRALWPDAYDISSSGTGDDEEFEDDENDDDGGDGNGIVYGNESDIDDNDEEELSSGGGGRKGIMSRARQRALKQFVEWSAQTGHLLPALAALPPAKRFSAVEECSGLLGHGASDKGIQTTILNALFDLKVIAISAHLLVLCNPLSLNSTAFQQTYSQASNLHMCAFSDYAHRRTNWHTSLRALACSKPDRRSLE